MWAWSWEEVMENPWLTVYPPKKTLVIQTLITHAVSNPRLGHQVSKHQNDNHFL